MSLLVEQVANVISSQNSSFSQLFANSLLLSGGGINASGNAISSIAPQAPAPTRYVNFSVNGVSYKTPAYESVVIT